MTEDKEAFITIVASEIVLVSVDDEAVELDDALEPLETAQDDTGKES